MGGAERIEAGGLWITLKTPPWTASRPRREQPQIGTMRVPPQSDIASGSPALVWTSVRSGALLSRGRVMTQQQAIHAVLTHSRNEIVQSGTTPTRITYRTPRSSSGGVEAVVVYEGALPELDQPIPRPTQRDDTPTVVAAQPQTPPVTPGMRYRVWHQPLDNVDHAAETFDDQFFIQTATLAEAVQLERVLAAYDTWADRNGEHDIEVWDGTTWTGDIEPAALAAAQVLLQRIHRLDDITEAGTPSADLR